MLFGKRKRVVNRILIVEDEPLTAFDNEVMLGDLGYEVVATLDSFEDAIELLDREDIDLILSDYHLSSERRNMRSQSSFQPATDCHLSPRNWRSAASTSPTVSGP
jgi:CheY-like chemotaxis protein